MSGFITTKLYTVQDFDTLEGIAARNDSTIGQLMKLNRMPNRTIFSGQTLLVPVIVEATDDEFHDANGSPKASSPIVSSKSKQFPGHLELKPLSRECSPVPFDKESTSLRWKRFLKIHVRQFTETEGFVSGVLLVTPNCIMFDPDVSHPLVIENGSEKYGMVAPMDAIVSIALFKNASAITEERHSPDEVYRAPNVGELDFFFPYTSARYFFRTISEKCSAESNPSVSADSNRPKVFKTLSHGMSYINRAGGSILQRAQSVSGSSAVKAARMVTNMPRKLVHMSTGWLGTVPTGKRLNSMESTCGSDKAKKSSPLFPTVDEMFPYERPGGACTQLPFFLHIFLNERIMREKADSLGELSRSLKNEFWFSMPKEMADPFYAFLVRCCPEKYGHELDSTSGEVCDVQKYKRKTFLSSNCTLNEEWEIVSVDEIKRRLSLRDVADVAYHPLPPGCEESTILDEAMIRKLIDVLPARAQSYPWVLVYSSELHGFALSTMYRMMSSLKECLSPSLLVVRDTSDHTFGGIVSCRFHVSEHFYGTGESLLFTDHPKFRVFRWTGQNEYIVKGSLESLALGAGKGFNGLWLDSDFYRGRTESCETFGNDPLTEPSEFLIAAVEAWCFRLE
ncbi:Oxidation resistance protein 1 [Trichuris trichiura]|uniref:Oxidation resistance protein 1 n=1 Tax=Trichuris trichiura TaxID=36087 RepID=A0A077Z6D6_TRITR|nr:Oxidation resistance protein 1 [Trichuris trichiura]